MNTRSLNPWVAIVAIVIVVIVVIAIGVRAFRPPPLQQPMAPPGKALTGPINYGSAYGLKPSQTNPPGKPASH